MTANGELLGNKLRLTTLLGEGAFGAVWAAEHLVLGIEVAVKILRPELASEQKLTVRFLQEARTVAKLSSPHIVSVFDCDVSADGRPYLVMERLRGMDLEHYLRVYGQLPLASVSELLVQMCGALSEAHGQRVVHRDIKPSNVFLVDPSEGVDVRLLDFGIAKQLDGSMALTATNALLGSPRYMSPEQLDDPRYIDHRADVWAVAVVIYQCLFARPPFEGESLVPLRLSISLGSPPAPSTLRPELPPALDEWVQRAFARKLTDRFQSAQALLEGFRLAVATVAPSTRPAQSAHGATLRLDDAPLRFGATHRLDDLPPAHSAGVLSTTIQSAGQRSSSQPAPPKTLAATVADARLSSRPPQLTTLASEPTDSAMRPFAASPAASGLGAIPRPEPRATRAGLSPGVSLSLLVLAAALALFGAWLIWW